MPGGPRRGAVRRDRRGSRGGARRARIRRGPAPRLKDESVVLHERTALRLAYRHAVAGGLDTALAAGAVLAPLAEDDRGLTAVMPSALSWFYVVGEKEAKEGARRDLDGHLADWSERGVLVEPEEGECGCLSALPRLVLDDRPRRRGGGHID